MFFTLYKWEIKKMLTLKKVIILLTIAIIVLILVSTVFNLQPTYIQEELEEPEETSNPNIIRIPFSLSRKVAVFRDEREARDILWSFERNLQHFESREKDVDFFRRIDMIYDARAKITVMQYVIDNELYGEEVSPYFGSKILFPIKKTTQGFVTFYLYIMSFVIVIYGIVCGANAYGKEMKTVTLKMVFIRTIKINMLTLSKLLSALTISTCFLIITALFAYIYGNLVYENIKTAYIYVFNSRYAFMASSNLSFILLFLSILIRVWSYVALSMAISTITRNNILSIAISALLAMDVSFTILKNLGLARFSFSYTSNIFTEYFALRAIVYGDSNFYQSFILLAIYVTIFIASTFIIFNKRDIV